VENETSDTPPKYQGPLLSPPFLMTSATKQMRPNGRGLRPRPRWGSLQHSPDPLAGFKGPTSKGKVGRGRGREGKEG